MDEKEKKQKSLSLRLSDTQHSMLINLRNQLIRVNNTDILCAGIELLHIFLEETRQDNRVYEELMNALIIRGELNRCISKPNNPQIDNEANKEELNKSLIANKIQIIQLLNTIIEESSNKFILSDKSGE